MRVLHIDTGKEMRGGQWQVLYLLRGLRERGHDCLLLARKGSPLFQAATQEGFRTWPASLLRLRSLSRDASLVHAHDARAHALAAVAAKCPVVVSRRVAFPIKRGPASRWKYARASRFIAVSAFVKRLLVDTGIHEGRVAVVYDGVPLLEPREPDGPVLAPAVWDPRKGYRLVQEAAELAGIDVRFSRDLARDLPGARMFVYITDEEGLGSAVLLAMSAGVPVLASAVGGLPEIVEDGHTGLLVGNNPRRIAVRMCRLLEDQALAARLTQAARQRVINQFSIAAMVDATSRLYEECRND